MSKSSWKDASYNFKTEESVDRVEASSSKSSGQIEASNMLPIVVLATDGRVIDALSHQSTRSVYPVFGDKK